MRATRRALGITAAAGALLFAGEAGAQTTPTLVDPKLADGGFTFRNAAVDAGVAQAPASYEVTWYAFDNATGMHRSVADAVRIAAGQSVALPAALTSEAFVMAAVSAQGGHANWRCCVGRARYGRPGCVQRDPNN